MNGYDWWWLGIECKFKKKISDVVVFYVVGGKKYCEGFFFFLKFE